VAGARIALVAAVAAITWLALTAAQPAMPSGGDKLAHAAAFLTLALLADFAFPAAGFGTPKVLSLLAFGLALELLQATLEHREGSVTDWVADVAGIAGYRLLIPLLRRLPGTRRRWDRGPSPVPPVLVE
jgi:VanZ family protein